MKTVAILFATLFVVIGVLAYAGVITGNINLDLTGSLFVGDTEEVNNEVSSNNGFPFVLLSDETTSTNTLIGEWPTYYDQPSSLRITLPRTMIVPPPEVFQLPDPVYTILDPDQLVYQQPPPIVVVPIYPTIFSTGEVQYIDIEGGFYGIITDDGEHYEPNNLASEFMVDDLQISFKAKIMEDQVSFHMWGTIIEILEIEVLD